MVRHNDVDSSKVPEVAAFENAKSNLQAFKQANQAFFLVLDGLLEAYNTTREDAEKAVRGLGVSCSDFEFYQKTTTVNADALYAAVGHDAFLSAGGTITNKVVYKIDPKKLQLAAEKRLIPKDVVDEVIKVTPNYHVPPPMVLP
jgi:hypothetical protein